MYKLQIFVNKLFQYCPPNVSEWFYKKLYWVPHNKLHLEGRNEILYNGIYYDVSNFMEKHPGGIVIEVLVDSREDATLAVQQFHHRSIKKVLALMKTLPHRRANENDFKLMDSAAQERHNALTADFLDLFHAFQKEGLFTPNPFHVFLRSIEVLLLCALGFYFLQLQPLTLLQRTIGILSLGLGMGRAGWVMHEGSHNSLLGIPKVDKCISQFFFGLVMGFSSSYWYFEHSRHHAAPQHVKYDVDLETIPLLAFNKKQITKPGLDQFMLMRYQSWIFIPVTTFMVMMGWRFGRHPYHCYQNGQWFDIVRMVVHVITFVWAAGFTNYCLAHYFTCVYLFVSIFLSHSFLPEVEEPTHWVEYALTHSANIRSSWWVDYWMGNLNYQIEHHLFPTMPQYKNKLCRDRIKALAKKHNLPYHLFSFAEGVVKLLDNLTDVAKEL